MVVGLKGEGLAQIVIIAGIPDKVNARKRTRISLDEVFRASQLTIYERGDLDIRTVVHKNSVKVGLASNIHVIHEIMVIKA